MSWQRGSRWEWDAPPDAVRVRIAGISGGQAQADVANGKVEFAESVTETLPAGKWVAEWELENGELLPGGTFDVAPSLKTDGLAGVFGKLTHAERMVLALEELALKAAEGGPLSLSTADGTSMNFESRDDISTELAKWRRVVQAERGGRPMMRLRV